jgi:hypothetical protein
MGKGKSAADRWRPSAERAKSDRANLVQADRRAETASCRLALAVLVAVFSVRLLFFESRWFDPDEFEHLHAAWCTANGLVPYRDFFEHHTPWLYYGLAPLFRVFRADADPNAAIKAITAARGLCLVVAAVALWGLVSIGKAWMGALAGLAGAVFLAGMPVFLDKTPGGRRRDSPWLCYSVSGRAVGRFSLWERAVWPGFGASSLAEPAETGWGSSFPPRWVGHRSDRGERRVDGPN